MKHTSILLAAFLFVLPAPPASAEEEEQEAPAPQVILELGRAYQPHASSFPKGEGLVSRKRNRRPGSDLPERAQREAAFARVPGLASHLQEMDELDRDMLFVRSQRGELPVLQQLYPAIPQQTLHALVDEVRKP